MPGLEIELLPRQRHIPFGIAIEERECLDDNGDGGVQLPSLAAQVGSAGPVGIRAARFIAMMSASPTPSFRRQGGGTFPALPPGAMRKKLGQEAVAAGFRAAGISTTTVSNSLGI